MKEKLLFKRRSLVFELEEMTGRYDRLATEIAELENESYQAKMIEEYLSEQYAKLRKDFPIDRAIEPEITQSINTKKLDVDDILRKYESDHDEVRKLDWPLRKARIEREFEERHGKGSWETMTEYNQRIRELKRKEKELEKEYDFADKESKKTCLIQLKRIFGELEIDIKRYYPKGISKQNLMSFIGIMETVCEKGKCCGTVPMSFQQKIYKWKTVADEIPMDVERYNKEKEETARRLLQERLNAKKIEADTTRSKIGNKHRDLSLKTKEFDILSATIQAFESELDCKKDAVIVESEKKRCTLQCNFENEAQEMKMQCDEEIRKLRMSITNSRSLLTQKEEEQTRIRNKKIEMEEALQSTFFLAVGKKRKLKEEIDEIELLLSTGESDILAQRDEISKLEKENPKATLADALTKKERALQEAISQEAQKREKRLTEIDSELKALKAESQRVQKEISDLSHSENTLRETMDKANESVLILKEKLCHFHEKYLIETFGKEFCFGDHIDQKKAEKTELENSIKETKKQIEVVDSELLNLEKEMTAQREAAIKAQIEKAKEEERLRAEQLEREKRIRQEMLAREEERNAIEEKSSFTIGVAQLVGELEADPNHRLLQEDSFPWIDDGKRTITNSIVRKKYTQRTPMPNCRQYVVFFTDNKGNPISDKRLIEQETTREEIATSFELKATGSFTKENYYLLALDFDTGKVVGAQKYKINISFTNDFDF